MKEKRKIITLEYNGGRDMTNGLFTKILVATDGSDRNRAAVNEALRIGKACGAPVHAVYIIDRSTFESSADGGVTGDAWALVQSEAAAALAHVRSLGAGVSVETVILEGKPAAEIVRYAGDQKIDLIVIGTQGKQGIARFLLGSVAESVIRSTPCRVLVVK
jgi:nucleotide-binding universal stress UspA family protein